MQAVPQREDSRREGGAMKIPGALRKIDRGAAARTRLGGSISEQSEGSGLSTTRIQAAVGEDPPGANCATGTLLLGQERDLGHSRDRKAIDQLPSALVGKAGEGKRIEEARRDEDQLGGAFEGRAPGAHERPMEPGGDLPPLR